MRYNYRPSFAVALIISVVSISTAAQEREYKDKTCRRIPCTAAEQPVRIIEVRNLQGEDFLRRLEVEVKNVSTKPIYHISLNVSFPDLKFKGSEYGFPLIFGERGTWSATSRSQPGDISLNPGETYVFKVPEPIYEGFEAYAQRSNLATSAPKMVILDIHLISFGDGTGMQAGLPSPWRR